MATDAGILPPVEDRLGALDGLRGFMAAWVLIGHACLFTGFPLPVLKNPGHAVDGFMMLSGFLMTYHSLLRQKRAPLTSTKTWLVFWIRRFFRIAPLYYVLLPIAYIFKAHYLHWRNAIDYSIRASAPAPWAIGPAFNWQHVALHITFLFGLMPRYSTSLVIPDWSLSLEMQFYAAFPLLLLLALRLRWIPFFFCCLGVTELFRHTLGHLFFQPSLLPCSLVWFAMGMVWAQAYLTKNSRLVAVGLLGSLLSRDLEAIALVVFFAWILFAEGWVGCGRFVEVCRRGLSGRVASFMAGASYSVYLSHLLVLTPVIYLLTQTSLSRPARFGIATAVTLGVTYTASLLFERIEAAGIYAGKKIAGHLQI